MRASDVVTRRLVAQRISSTTFTRPEQVVARLGAVQAQDYLGALWAIGLRLTDGSDREVERAIEERRIVRTWPMRGTLHFVAAADARWMTELLAPRAAAGAAGRLRSFGVDAPLLARARRALVKQLVGGRRLTRPAAYRILERAGIRTEASRGLHVLWRLAHERLVCFGPREGKQHTFVLFDEWLPSANKMPRDAALAELAHRYFTGHGPATLADFAWWSGMTLADARHAVHLADKRIERVTVAGQSLFCNPSARSPSLSRSRAHLLPAFDEFLVGYTDRAAAVAASHRVHVDAGGGILKPTIVLDGRVVGTWKRRVERRHVVVELAPFDGLGKSNTAALAPALERYGRFLGLEVRLE